MVLGVKVLIGILEEQHETHQHGVTEIESTRRIIEKRLCETLKTLYLCVESTERSKKVKG
jgi:hypothetical protein